MGSLYFNLFLDNLAEFDDEVEVAGYLLFLKESLADKRPGLGDIILTREQPLQEVVDTFHTPMMAHQDYTVVVIDTTAFEDGGTLTVDIQVGRDDAICLTETKNFRQKKFLMACIPQFGTVSKVTNMRRHLTLLLFRF